MSQVWICRACTYANPNPHSMACQMCNTPRHGMPQQRTVAYGYPNQGQQYVPQQQQQFYGAQPMMMNQQQQQQQHYGNPFHQQQMVGVPSPQNRVIVQQQYAQQQQQTFIDLDRPWVCPACRSNCRAEVALCANCGYFDQIRMSELDRRKHDRQETCAWCLCCSILLAWCAC